MIVLTPSTHIDADFIVAAESDAETSRFIIPWARERHVEAMKDPDCAHLIIRHSKTAERLGFFHVVWRAALRAVKTLAFDRLEAHRLWLDVKSKNEGARHLYESEGFLEDDEYESLVLMSMLRREHAGFQAALCAKG